MLNKKYLKITKQINTLYKDVNPFKLSVEAREHYKHLTSEDLVYGEINIPTILALLRLISPKNNQVFYDLGSGSGKVMIATKLCYPNLTVKGIEVVTELQEMAKSRWHSLLKKHPKKLSHSQIDFICANLLDSNFEEADIVFINATSFTAQTWQLLILKLDKLKIGSKILVTSKKLPQTSYQPLYIGSELMSWGFTTTSLYEKIR